MKFFYLFFAIVLILIITFFSLCYWQDRYPLFIGFYDIAYHASTAVGFQRCGGFTLTNFWAGHSLEGSPYIYFPFFHIVGLLILSLGANPFFLTYWLSWLLLPLSFISVLLFTYKAYGEKVAVYAVLLLSLSPLWMEKQWGLPPQSFVFVIIPLIFLALIKERYIIVVLLSLCCMATHFTGVLLFPTLFLYALQNKHQRKPLLIILGIIFLAGLPGIWFAIRRISSGFVGIALQESLIRDSLSRLFGIKWFHGYMGWLAILGLIICYLKRDKFLILPSYFFVFLPLAWTTKHIRFWGAPALFIFSLLGAVALGTFHSWLEKRGRGKLRSFGSFAIFVLIFLAANIAFYYTSHPSVRLKTPTIIFLKNRDIWPKSKPLFSPGDRQKMIKLIKEKVNVDEFFSIDSSQNINNFVAAYTGRSTVLPYSLGNIPEGMKLVVAGKSPSADYAFLERINEKFSAYILTDSARAAKVKVPKPLVKTETIRIVFLVIAIAAFATLPFAKKVLHS